jgi:hypothetical protein
MERERVRVAAATLPPRLADALAVLTPSNARRVADVWVGASPAADGGVAVTVSWAPRERLGELPASSAAATVTLNEQTIFDGVIDGRSVSFPASAGEAKIELALRNANGELLDREIRRFTVPEFAAAALSLGTPMVLLARTPADLRAIASGASTRPHAGREFVPTDRLIVRVPVTSTEASVTARLLNNKGAVLTSLQVLRLHPGDRPEIGEGGEIDLPLSSIARGDYMILMEAAKASDRAQTFMAIRVK